MSIQIIFKDNNRFKPHFNREMCDRANPNGKMIHTKEDYLREMKQRGLEPYRPQEVKQYEKKKYLPSKEAREIVSYVQAHKDKEGKVTITPKIREWIEENSGHKKARRIKGDSSKGGFSQ